MILLKNKYDPKKKAYTSIWAIVDKDRKVRLLDLNDRRRRRPRKDPRYHYTDIVWEAGRHGVCARTPP